MGVVGFSNPPASINVPVGKNTETVITVSNNGSVPVHDVSVSQISDCEGLELSISPQVVGVIEGGQSADFTLSLTANYTIKPGNYQVEVMMNTTEGVTDSFSSVLVVSVGSVSEAEPSAAESAPGVAEPAVPGPVPEEQPTPAEPPKPEEKAAGEGTIADTIKEVQSKSIETGTPVGSLQEAGTGAEPPSTPAPEPAPAAEPGPSVLTPAEVPKYEAKKEKKPVSEYLNKKTLIILLAVVLVGMILIMDMANFVDLGIL